MKSDGQMDKKSWGWLPMHMPGVAKLMRDKRAKLGDAHVNECWRRGVILGEPGWFFAVEGSLSVGVPENDQLLAWFASLKLTKTQALLDIRNPEVTDGTN